MRRSRRIRFALATVLATALFLSVAALATGKPGKPKPVKEAQASAAQVSGAQYGRNRVPVCHKGKTIRIAQPAVPAHLRHGDTPGPCP
jgi:hypothetical protein